MRIKLNTLAAVVAIGAWGAGSAVAESTMTVVAHTGQAAPGTSGVFAGRPRSSILLDDGRVSFSWTVDSASQSEDVIEGIWITSVNGLDSVVLDGTPILDRDGGLNIYGPSPSGYHASSGRIAFSGEARTPEAAGFHVGEFVWNGHSIETLAIGGEHLPGVPSNRVFDSMYYPKFNGSGQIAVNALFMDDDAGEYVFQFYTFTGVPGSWNVLIKEGDSIPGLPQGHVVDGNVSTVRMHDDGSVTFQAFIANGWKGPRVGSGIFRGRAGGTIEPLVMKGDPAPGIPGVTIREIWNSSVTDDGKLHLLARLSERQPGDRTVDDVILAGRPGSLQVVARSRGPAPGTTKYFSPHWDEEEDLHVFRKIAVNEAGQLALAARLASSPDSGVAEDDWGVWMHNDGATQLIARSGQSAPGSGEGVTFQGEFGSPVLNDLGQIVFSGLLSDGRRGLFGSDTSNTLHLLVADGESLWIDGEQQSVLVDRFQYTLNDAGQLAFRVTYGESGHAIVTTTMPIPEPSVLSVLLLGVAAVPRNRSQPRKR